MKILVTGATGFIGNYLIEELLKDNSNQIIATSRDIKKAKSSPWFGKVKYIQYDLDNNIDNLYEFFEKPDNMIHLAWSNLSDYNNLSHISVELFNHFSFIENMIKGGLKDVSITGTCFEYGKIDGCLSENMMPSPSNPYAIAKDTLRKFIVELEKNYNFTYKWIRLFYMYGNGQSDKSLIPMLDRAILDKNNEFNMSGGEQLRDFLTISEVVKNISLISNQNLYNNQVINCCSGSPISVRALVENYLLKRKYTMKLNLGFYKYPNYEAMAFWGDNKKLNNIREKTLE
jgi:dTDP-6-deoxy-L-talose 4-dehydrogenase (NAD+)